jgi:hypothetical protein
LAADQAQDYGIINQSGTSNFSPGAITVETGGTLNLLGGSINTPSLNNQGILNVSGGTLNLSAGLISNGGVFIQTGGTAAISSLFRINGTYNLSAGTLAAATFNVGVVGTGGIGTVRQAGGIVSAGPLTLAAAASTTGYYYLSGGNLNASSETIASFTSSTTGIFNQSAGSNTDSGGLTIGNSSNTSVTADYFITGGSLSTGGVIKVATNGLFEYDGGTVSSNVANYGRLNVRGGGTLTLTGNFTNETGATLKTYGTTFDVSVTFINNGTYSSDPATNRFGNLAIGPGGTLLGGVGDKFIVTGNLLNASANSTSWNTLQAALSFAAGANNSHTFSVTGVDDGASWNGYTNNFAWASLSLGDDHRSCWLTGTATRMRDCT